MVSKKAVIAFSIGMVLLGAGCQPAAPNQPVQKPVLEQKLLTYQNKLGQYSFTYPERLKISSDRGVPTPSSTAIMLFDIPEGVVVPDNVAPLVEFSVIKTTVYPEHKLELLRKEYFSGVSTTEHAITINNLTGSEIIRQGAAGDDVAVYQLLYFPRAKNELIVTQFEPSKTNDSATSVINSLQITP